jgi:pentatricopeptide repeat protein
MRYADIARAAASRVDSCELHAYTEFVAGTVCEIDDLDRQREILEPLIAQVDSLDDPSPALRAIHVRAGNFFGIDDIGGSYRYIRQLIELSTAYDWPDGQLLGWHGEGMIRGGLTDWTGAVESERRTAALASEILNKEFEARSCNVIGEAYAKELDDGYERAIPWLKRALKVAPKTVPIAATYHVNLGAALVATGRLEEAETHVQPALDGGRAAGYIANAFQFVSALRRAQGRYSEAMENARKGIAEGPTSLFVIWELKAALGQMLIECGDTDAGIDALRESIDLIEARRAESTSSAMIRAHYFATRQWVYTSLLDVLFQRKEYDEALAIAERMKARSLDDSLFDQKTPVALSADEQKCEHELNQRIVDLNREVIVAHGAKETDARRKLITARAQLVEFSNEMAMRHSHSLAARAAIDPSELAATWRGPAVVEYAILPDSIVAFVVRNGSVRARKLPRAKIEATTTRLLQSIEQRDLEYDADALRSVAEERPAQHRPRRLPLARAVRCAAHTGADLRRGALLDRVRAVAVDARARAAASQRRRHAEGAPRPRRSAGRQSLARRASRCGARSSRVVGAVRRAAQHGAHRRRRYRINAEARHRQLPHRAPRGARHRR